MVPVKTRDAPSVTTEVSLLQALIYRLMNGLKTLIPNPP
jgi:hypothetical protein